MEEWNGETSKEIGEWVLVTIKGDQQPESYTTNFDLVAGDSRVEYLGTNSLGQQECKEL